MDLDIEPKLGIVQEQISGYHEFGTSEQITELYAALGMAQGKFTAIRRSKEVYIRSDKGNYKFTYAPLEDLIAATRPALTEHGLTVLTPAINEAGGSKVLIILAHKGGGRLVSEFRYTPALDIKQTAGVITYVRRYGYSSILCLAADDDADDQGGDHTTSAMPDQSRSSAGGAGPYFCAMCDEELHEVRFRDGTIWSTAQLAQYGMRKHGHALCMDHYREANVARKPAEESGQAPNGQGAPTNAQVDAFGSMSRVELQQKFAAEWNKAKAANLKPSIMQTLLASGWTGEIMKVPVSKIADEEFAAVIAELAALRTGQSVGEEQGLLVTTADDIPWYPMVSIVDDERLAPLIHEAENG